MLILAHVLIACSSIISSSWLLFAPSRLKLYVSYGLTGLTLASGTYLVVDRHAPMLSTCEAGLCYLAVVGVVIAAGRYRLSHQE